MFPRVEVRHLQAVLVLAEELSFTRAADRLHITQSFLCRYEPQIMSPKQMDLLLSA